MVQQYKRMKLDEKNHELTKNALDEFSQLPLFFLNFYGSTDVNVIFQSLEHAIYAHDI